VDRVDLVYTNAGGGHRCSAEAVGAALSAKDSWNVRFVASQEILRPADRVYRLTGVCMEDYYNFALRRSWTWGGSLVVPLLHSAIRRTHREQAELLTEHWRRSPADLVVSLFPHYNRAIGEGLHRALPGVPLVVVLTDFADLPPHTWIELQDQFVVCGTELAVSQARALGMPPHRVFRTSGMVVHPRFYEPQTADRAAERQRLGLDPELPTGIVTFGGHGSATMIEIARRLDRAKLAVQVIFLCGRNSKLAARLASSDLRLRRLVVEYTTDVPKYMHLADFFVGKPGPASISEALLMKLPVIVESSARTMPQERYNVEWVLRNGVGLAAPSFRVIDRVVAELLDPGCYARMRANAAAIENRAVFEVVEILGEILNNSRRSLTSGPVSMAR
jgi:hypothetical protein